MEYTIPSDATPEQADRIRRDIKLYNEMQRVENMIGRFAETLERRGVFAPGDAHYIITGEEPIEGFEEASWGHAEKLLSLSRGA